MHLHGFIWFLLLARQPRKQKSKCRKQGRFQKSHRPFVGVLMTRLQRFFFFAPSNDVGRLLCSLLLLALMFRVSVCPRNAPTQFNQARRRRRRKTIENVCVFFFLASTSRPCLLPLS
jgi:hypothetical protein